MAIKARMEQEEAGDNGGNIESTTVVEDLQNVGKNRDDESTGAQLLGFQ